VVRHVNQENGENKENYPQQSSPRKNTSAAVKLSLELFRRILGYGKTFIKERFYTGQFIHCSLSQTPFSFPSKPGARQRSQGCMIRL